MDQKFRSRRTLLKTFADSVEAQHLADVQRLQDFVVQHQSLRQAFDSIAFVDMDGNLVASLNGTQQLANINIKDRAYFQQTVAAKEGVISQPYRNRLNGLAQIAMTEPVLDGEGKVLYVISGAISLKEQNFLGEFANTRFGQSDGHGRWACPRGLALATQALGAAARTHAGLARGHQLRAPGGLRRPGRDRRSLADLRFADAGASALPRQARRERLLSTPGGVSLDDRNPQLARPGARFASHPGWGRGLGSRLGLRQSAIAAAPGLRPFSLFSIHLLSLLSKQPRFPCNVLCGTEEYMSTEKTETLNLRVTPEFKQLLRDAAAAEHRSQTNLLEKLVRDHCASSATAAAVGGFAGAVPTQLTTNKRSA